MSLFFREKDLTSQSKHIKFLNRYLLLMKYTNRHIKFLGLFLGISLLSACKVTKYDILFDVNSKLTDNALFQQMKVEAEKNYVIDKFDEISFRLFTKKGELLIDPDGQLLIQGTRNPLQNRGSGSNSNQNQTYTVQDDGKIYLPLVGGLDVQGRKIYQLDSLISVAFHQYYEDSYARTQVENRRIIVMGALGNQVIKLPYEGMHLAEVLVMAGGNLDRNTRNDKIRIIRNILSDQPIIQSVDLSTWEGVQNANLQIQPNDVVYVEPRRRKILQATEEIRNITSIFAQVTGVITSTITLWVVLRNTN